MTNSTHVSHVLVKFDTIRRNMPIHYSVWRLLSDKSNVMQRQTTWNNRVPTGSAYILVYDAACGLGCRCQRFGVARCFRLPVEIVGSELTNGFECCLGKVSAARDSPWCYTRNFNITTARRNHFLLFLCVSQVYIMLDDVSVIYRLRLGFFNP